MTSVHIAALWIYPVKSCAGVTLPDAVLTDKGLAYDRAWMVVDAQGEMLTQRELPRMALIQPQLVSQASHVSLVLRAPGMPQLAVPDTPWAHARCHVRVWSEVVPAFEVGTPASDWLTQFLLDSPAGQAHTAHIPGPLRLVRFDEAHARSSSAQWTQGHTALNRFSDGFSVLVVSQASLDELNHRLAQQGQAAVDMRRFRPNVVLAGAQWQAHDEDRVGAMHIQTETGQAVLLPVKPCPRCPIPDIDPDTAESAQVVSPVLQTYRQDARVNAAVTFGMNALVLQGAGQRLALGQGVQAEWAF